MRKQIIEKYFICPRCGAKMTLTDDGRSTFCLGERRHLWDFSSSGYVNLAPGTGGDSADCVKARKRFLSLGHYAPLADAVAAAVVRFSDGESVVDAGCGEGYYGQRIAKEAGSLIGFDLSRPTVEAAAKRKIQNALFAVVGINAMPIRSESVSAVTNVFAPCFEGEFCRVLKKGGVVVIAAAGERHLLSLKEAIYESSTLNTERADLPSSLRLIDESRLTYDFTLDSPEKISDLFAMTPYYYRTNRESLERLSRLERLTVNADFEIKVYKKDQLK